VAEPFWAEGANELLRHGYTYSGHAAACAVALANLDVIESENLIGRVRELEPVLDAALRPLEEHPLVDEVRTVGLLGAVEIKDGPADAVSAAALERGVSSRALRSAALKISPPFVIDEAQLTRVADVIRESLDSVS